MNRYFLFLAALLAGGCASIEPGNPPVLPPRNASPTAVPVAPVRVPGIISLRDALALALEHSPGLGVLALEAEALAGAEMQSGMLPNPTMSVDVENFGRSRMRLGQLNGPEYTLAFGQLVELGGKRAARVRAAKLDRRLALWDYEVARLDLLSRTARDFVALLTAQEEAALAVEGARVGEETFEAVRAKIDAGKVSPVEGSRASVLRSRSRLEVERTSGLVASARARLAANWGGAGAEFEGAAGSLGAPGAIPDLEGLIAELSTHPAIAKWQDEVARCGEELKMARAKRIPNPTVGGGARFLDESDESAFVVGFSIPLPVLDRNEGGIYEADRRLAKAKAEQRAMFIERRAALVVAHAEAKNARQRVVAFEGEILPAARTAFESTREAYVTGKVGLTDVLDTERVWFSTRRELLEALREFHARKAELEALAGRALDELPSGVKKPQTGN